MITPERLLGPQAETELSPTETVAVMTAELADPTSGWHQRFYDPVTGIQPTPTWQLPETMYGHMLLIKDETSHPVTINGQIYEIGAFKRRGAWAAAQAPPKPGEQQADILTTGSAGNHAQGVALAAKLMGLRAEVHCGRDISHAKLFKNTALGAEVKAYYDSVDDAIVAAALEAGKSDDGLVRRFIHPFDQPEVIAGQATMVEEWLRSLEALQAEGEADLLRDDITVVVAIGGGGLASGWVAGLQVARQQGRIGHNVRLVGAQMQNCDAMNRLLYGPAPTAGYPLMQYLDKTCDGTAVTAPGLLTREICRDGLDGIVVLSPAEVGVGMEQLGQTLAKDVEPAGALSYAAAQKLMAERPHTAISRRSLVTCVVSSANVTPQTTQYFSNKVYTARAQLAFAALSKTHLQCERAFEAELNDSDDPNRDGETYQVNITAGVAATASPTHMYRIDPEHARREYLAGLNAGDV